MFYNLGGGTFDVSLLSINKTSVNVISNSGDNHLGGDDFDARLLEHFMKIYKTKYNIDISKDKKALVRLKI